MAANIDRNSLVDREAHAAYIGLQQVSFNLNIKNV